MGGGSSSSRYGNTERSGWASVWEKSISFHNNHFKFYETTHHEMMHGIGLSHQSGLTYGWSYALKGTINKLYKEGVNPIVNVPKYIFETKYLEDKKLQISVYKTSDASEDDVVFEILSSRALINDEFTIEQSASDNSNQVTLTSKKDVFTRFFLRLYASDSREIMSKIITPSNLINTYLATNDKTNRRYHIISHYTWLKMASLSSTSQQPKDAAGICKAWLGEGSILGYDPDALKIKTDFRELLTSKKLLGQGPLNRRWSAYRVYNYSNNSYSKKWTSYNKNIPDNTVGIFCME
jgi:hypothetical protein